MRNKRVLMIGIGVLIATAAILHVVWHNVLPNAVHRSGPVDYGRVGAFRLTDQTGRPFGSADLEGRRWVANFIFTRCMGPCPVLSTKMARLHRDFEERADIAFVSFSVDPAHDTPSVLARYADGYDADATRWRFLTGDVDAVAAVIRDNFHVAVETPPHRGHAAPQIIHSTRFVLVEPDGRIARFFDSDDAGEMRRLRAALAAVPAVDPS